MLSTIPKTQKLFVMLGVMLAMLLAALDQTIIATAMPRIVSELHGLEHLSWVFTSYLLASTVVVPIYGKLSDIYGRKYFILLAIAIFLIGSVLSGLSQNMLQLILARGVQGLGAGGIMANAFAIIGDLFPPSERGKWQGLFGGVFGLASVIGPALGGYLTDYISWRWNFFINIPIGILALLVVWFLMPKIVSDIKDRYIDLWGAIVLTVALVSLLLGLVWGGTEFPWLSWEIISLLSLSLVSGIVFVKIEKKVREPVLPLDLFKNKIFSLSMLIIFLAGFGMFGAILFVPVFAQLVLGVSATNSGTIMTPMTLGLVFASVITGQVVSRTGRYKWIATLGLLLVTIGMYSLSQVSVQTTQMELVWKMILTGIGLGLTMPVFNLAVQNAFDHSKLGVATASVQLFRSIGGTVGTAVLGGLLNMMLSQKLSGLSADKLDINNLQALLITSKEKIDYEFLNKLRVVFSSSISEVFMIASLFMAVAFIASFFVKEIPLRKSHDEGPEEVGKQLAVEEGNIPARNEPII